MNNERDQADQPGANDSGRPLTRREAREIRSSGTLPATGVVAVSKGDRLAVTTPPVEPVDARQWTETSNRKSRAPHQQARWGCLVAVILVVAMGVGSYYFLNEPVTKVWNRIFPPPNPDYVGSGEGTVDFVIYNGDDGSDITHNLVKQGVIKGYDAFYSLLLATKPAPQFVPSVIRLKLKMSASAAIVALLDPKNRLENTFVIPEGMAMKDALQAAATASHIPLTELEDAAASPQSFGVPAEAKTLEGFLFPATYTVSPGMAARELIKMLVDRAFSALDQAGVSADQRWRTVVLASLIQREAGLASDYPKVARVFLNRLDPKLWPTGLLQSDATIAYGTGHTDRVTTTDAERADASNPYNTYVHAGLPPAPISNPGDLAIGSALRPADGPWLFFVTWNLQSGETIFSTTIAEHDAAVAKWQAWMQTNPSYG